MNVVECDYLIVGSGMAGLSTALKLAPHGKVLVITKRATRESNTNYAQGGIACVTLEADTFEMHVADTLNAGAGLCDEAVVRKIVSDAPQRMNELRAMGMQFTERENANGEPDLGREGGHSMRRILHAGDITGRHVQDVLLANVALEPNITVLENAQAIDLVTRSIDGRLSCVGCYVLNRISGEIFPVRAAYTVLATGGAGKVYRYTTNPDIASAGGIAIAWRAGAEIRNMEFIQFHPTCLYHPEAKSFLISEAVRGEGAELVDEQERPFMARYDNRGALAPRDIVARAIDHEMKTRGLDCVYLDIRHKGVDFLKRRFPNIYSECKSFGIDMATDLIPVVPAAHYCCGGIKTTVDGQTNIAGLLAVGETASTGLHGANRLASNSLLEAVACAHNAAQWMAAHPRKADVTDIVIPAWIYGDAVPSDEQVVVTHCWDEVRTCMWDYVGIVRTDKRLERALTRIANIRREIREYYFDYLVTSDMLELRNIADAALLIIKSAMHRKESRGLHYTLDYPLTSQNPQDTIMTFDPAHDACLG